LHTTERRESRSLLAQVVLSFWISKNQRGVSQVVGSFVGKELVGIELGVFVGADDGIELVGIFVGATLGEPLGSEIVGAPVGLEEVGA